MGEKENMMEKGLDRATTNQIECGSSRSDHDYKIFKNQHVEWAKCNVCGIRGWQRNAKGDEQRR